MAMDGGVSVIMEQVECHRMTWNDERVIMERDVSTGKKEIGVNCNIIPILLHRLHNQIS